LLKYVVILKVEMSQVALYSAVFSVDPSTSLFVFPSSVSRWLTVLSSFVRLFAQTLQKQQ